MDGSRHGRGGVWRNAMRWVGGVAGRIGPSCQERVLGWQRSGLDAPFPPGQIFHCTLINIVGTVATALLYIGNFENDG